MEHARSRRLLVVEDDPARRAILLRLLGVPAGAPGPATVVATLDEAREALLREEVDAVLLAWGLADVSGLHALASLTRLAPASPVVLVAEDLEEAAALEAIDVGAQDVVCLRRIGAAGLRQAVERAVRRQERLNHLVGAHGSFAARQPVGEEPEAEPVSLTVACQQGCLMVWDEIERRRAVVVIEEMPSVRTSPVYLRWVFKELIGNAVRHARPGDTPEVTLQCRPFPDGVRVTVDDSGPGIPPDRWHDVFEPGVTLGDDGGIGVGLATCRTVLDALGGAIWLEQSPIGGTRVVLTLPLTADVRVPALGAGE